MRAFLALEMAGAVRERHGELHPLWKSRFPGLRWVPPEKLHITLRFLGATRDDLVGTLRERVEKAVSSRPPFTLRIGPPGCFGSRRSPRVLWYGLEAGAEPLEEIAGDLEKIARKLRVEPEKRPWRAHLTLARNPGSEAVSGWEEALEGGLVGLEQAVERVTFFSSRILPGGAVYSVLWTAPLAG